MNDELTFLRWAFKHQPRFVHADITAVVEKDPLVFARDMYEAYEAETGNTVPNDYREIA